MNNYFDFMNGTQFINYDVLPSLTGKCVPNVTESQAQRFGKWLKGARERAGLTKAQLAQDAKIARSYVSNLEKVTENVLTGKPTVPSVKIVDKIARALNASLIEARRAAGYAAPDEVGSDDLTERIASLSKELPPETREMALRVMEALHRGEVVIANLPAQPSPKRQRKPPKSA